jgi:hypothetical protein
MAWGMMPVESSTGIKVISTNLLLDDEDQAVIWRGLLIDGLVRQFWTEVVWGRLDYLLVDLPPGTADVLLTVMQALPLDGAILVDQPAGAGGHGGAQGCPDDPGAGRAPPRVGGEHELLRLPADWCTPHHLWPQPRSGAGFCHGATTVGPDFYRS